jgi:hypothetical protein
MTHGHILCLHFYNCPELAQFLKSKGRDCTSTLCTNRKNAFPFIKNKRMKKGEDCGQHSGDVRVHAWQDNMVVSIIYMYHKDVKHLRVNKANNE